LRSSHFYQKSLFSNFSYIFFQLTEWRWWQGNCRGRWRKGCRGRMASILSLFFNGFFWWAPPWSADCTLGFIFRWYVCHFQRLL